MVVGYKPTTYDRGDQRDLLFFFFVFSLLSGKTKILEQTPGEGDGMGPPGEGLYRAIYTSIPHTGDPRGLERWEKMMTKQKTRTPPSTAKLTEEQRVAIVDEYLQDGTPMRALGEKYGVNKSTISRVINDSGVLEAAEKKADVRSRIALINLKNASADASEKLVELLGKQRGEKQVYADIQIIQQVLDRAGVRAEKSEKADVTVQFATGAGFTPAMPARADDSE